MPDSPDSVKARPSWAQRLKQWLVPTVILLMAAGIVFLIAGNWNTWASDRAAQETDDAYVRADLTPLSTKVAGLVATVAVSDYQAVKAGDLAGTVARRRFSRAGAAGRSRRGLRRRCAHQQSAAERIAGRSHNSGGRGDSRVGSGHRGGGGGDRGSEIDDRQCPQRNRRDQGRRGAYVIGAAAPGSADCDRVCNAAETGAGSGGRGALRAQLASREADLSTATAQLASRQADLARARARLGSSKAELEAQKRQRAVLDSQELLLRPISTRRELRSHWRGPIWVIPELLRRKTES